MTGVSENIIDWVLGVGDRRDACRVLVLNVREADNLEDQSVGGRLILERILKAPCVLYIRTGVSLLSRERFLYI